MLENDGRVVSNFIVQALRDEELTIYGDGSQTRSFCYVSDLVDGIVRLMNAEGADIHMPVNLGNPGEFTMKELAEMVAKTIRKPINVRFMPLPLDDPKQRQPNIDRARALLGWEPTVPLADGLQRTVAYFESVVRSDTKTPQTISV
jgi:UDP-glucuronate decarboxylase